MDPMGHFLRAQGYDSDEQLIGSVLRHLNSSELEQRTLHVVRSIRSLLALEEHPERERTLDIIMVQTISGLLKTLPFDVSVALLLAYQESPLGPALISAMAPMERVPSHELNSANETMNARINSDMIEKNVDDMHELMRACDRHAGLDGNGLPISLEKFHMKRLCSAETQSFSATIAPNLQEACTKTFLALRNEIYIPIRPEGTSNGSSNEFTNADQIDVMSFIEFLLATYGSLRNRLSHDATTPWFQGSVSGEVAERYLFSVTEAMLLTFIRKRFPGLLMMATDVVETTDEKGDQKMSDSLLEAIRRKTVLFTWLELMLRHTGSLIAGGIDGNVYWGKQREMMTHVANILHHLKISCTALAQLHSFSDILESIPNKEVSEETAVETGPLLNAVLNYIGEDRFSHDKKVRHVMTETGLVGIHDCINTYCIIQEIDDNGRAVLSNTTTTVQYPGAKPTATHFSDVPLASVFPPESAPVLTADRCAINCAEMPSICTAALEELGLLGIIRERQLQIGTMHLLWHDVRDHRPLWLREHSGEPVGGEFTLCYLLLSRKDAATLGILDRIFDASWESEQTFLESIHYPLPEDPVMVPIDYEDGDHPSEEPPPPSDEAGNEPEDAPTDEDELVGAELQDS